MFGKLDDGFFPEGKMEFADTVDANASASLFFHGFDYMNSGFVK